jgi:hypothetical protein
MDEADFLKMRLRTTPKPRLIIIEARTTNMYAAMNCGDMKRLTLKTSQEITITKNDEIIPVIICAPVALISK